MSTLKQLFWVVVGAVVGTAAGVGVAVAVGLYGQWRYPNDPSAGSGAIIVMLTAPLGFLLGIMTSCYFVIRYMKFRKSRGFDVVANVSERAAR